MTNTTDEIAELLDRIFLLHDEHGGYGLDCLLSCAEHLLRGVQNRAIERRASFLRIAEAEW